MRTKAEYHSESSKTRARVNLNDTRKVQKSIKNKKNKDLERNSGVLPAAAIECVRIIILLFSAPQRIIVQSSNIAF